MSLQQWHENGWIHDIKPSPAEVVNLMDLARREIGDASSGVSAPTDASGMHTTPCTRCVRRPFTHQDTPSARGDVDTREPWNR